ncbi:MAG: hypothetical protein NWS14_00130 [Pontimonas sp.]|nr:hypothetical protein [Pontimonas sp.]
MQTLSPLLGNQEPSAKHSPVDGVRNPLTDNALDLVEMCGLHLFDWQLDVLVDSIKVRASDPTKFAATETGLVVARQNGKGSILEARQLIGLFVLNEPLQIHTAHEYKTAMEHFLRIKALVEGSKMLMKDVKIIRTGAGDQGIILKNGSRLKFLARNGTSGRGFSSDTLYLDESFVLSNVTMGAVLPTMMARDNPSIWYTSSAPHKDSPVLRKVMNRGRAQEGGRLLYYEWGNDADVTPSDRSAWCRANPSLGLIIDPDLIEMAHATLDSAEFAREHLGVPEDEGVQADVPIPLDVWETLTDGKSMAVDEGVRLALDVSPDRQWSTFGISGHRSDGLRHVAVRDRRPGTDWVLARARELAEGHKTSIIIVAGSPAGAFIDSFAAAVPPIPVDVMSTVDYTAATGRFIDATRGEAPQLRHRGDPNIRLALAAVKLKNHSDGGQYWSRRSSEVDITPLTTSTMAHGRLDTLSEATEYLGGVTSLDDWLEDDE